jgi:hypothetical protein
VRKSRVKPIDAVAFANDLEQTIEPGDHVVFVTKSWSHISMSKGTYVGMRGQRAVVERQIIKKKLVHKVTGKLWSYDWRPEGMPEPQRATARYGTPEYFEQTRAHTKAQNDLYAAQNVEQRFNYHWVEFPAVVRTTLRCNRVIPVKVDCYKNLV